MSRNSRQFAIVVSVLVLCGLGFTARRIYRSPPVGRDDAFLSYWQCADGLTTALAQVKSNDDFVTSHPKIGDPDAESGQSMKDVCDDLCVQLDAFRAAIERMPEDEVEESARRHSDVVKHVKEAIANLMKRHADAPEILGEDWETYAEALEPAIAQP
jgi:hypothetical protein